MDKIHVKTLTVENIGRFGRTVIDFNEKFNLICGPNGSGKSTILDCITSFFSRSFGTPFPIKKRSSSEFGTLELEFFNSDNVFNKSSFSFKVHGVSPDEREYANIDELKGKGKYILKFNAQRDFPYSKISSISTDPSFRDSDWSNFCQIGIQFSCAKEGFIRRYLFSDKGGALSEQNLANFELAKSSFSILDPDVSFEKIMGNSFDIILKSKNGSVYLEKMSDGYKGAIYILLGLIKELDYRFPDETCNNFSGIILIDEIELHLHPLWQIKLLSKLRELFPNAQFIITSHSPNLMQSIRDSSELIMLKEDENGEVVAFHPEGNDYGFNGYRIDEIMKELMGLSSEYSEAFESVYKEFEAALKNKDIEKVHKYKEILLKMLSQNDELRDIININSSGVFIK